MKKIKEKKKNKFMETINKKECPKCKSADVFDVGDRAGWAQDPRTEDGIADPIFPIYECRKCGERFVYKAENLNGTAELNTKKLNKLVE